MQSSDDDIVEILRIFKESKFAFLHLEHDGLKRTLGDPGAAPSAPWTRAAAPRPEPPVAARDPDLVPIEAPIGKFYAAPSPADPPFVTPGTPVAGGATVALIEAMKVFASVLAKVAGTIERVLVSDGLSVGFGQPLFLMRPDVERKA